MEEMHSARLGEEHGASVPFSGMPSSQHLRAFANLEALQTPIV